MRSQIAGPKVIMLEQAACDGYDETYSMNLVKKVVKLKTDLTLIEGEIPEKTVAELAACNVTAISSVKRSVLELISRMTKSKIAVSISDIPNYRKNAAGSCIEFTAKSVDTKTLITLKTDIKKCLGGSILLSSESDLELANAKSAAKRLILDCRNAILESEMLLSFHCEMTNSLISEQYAIRAAFVYQSLTENSCMTPQQISIQFYLDGDSPLGLKLIRFCKQIGEKCVCGVNFSQHFHVFMNNRGFVRISLREMTPEKIEITEKDPIFCEVFCRKCNEGVGRVSFSPLVWEYSFYKFINNFSLPLQRSHRYHICKGDVFRDYRYMFTVQNVELKVEYEEIRVMTLMEPIARSQFVSEQAAEYFESVKLKAVVDLKSAGSETVSQLRLSLEDLLQEIDSLVATDENALRKPNFDSFKSELNYCLIDITRQIAIVSTLAESDFFSFFSVESFRKSLFLSICRAKTAYENVKYAISNPSKAAEKQRSDSSQLVPFQKQSVSPSQSLATSGESYWYQSEDGFVSNSKGRNSPAVDSPCRFPHPSQSTHKFDPLLRSRDFEYLQHGALTLPASPFSACIPIEEDDPLSLLSYCLSSALYKRDVIDPVRLSENSEIRLKHDLLSSENYHFSAVFSTYEESDLEHADNRPEMLKLYGASFSFSVTAYFAKQFNAIQSTYCAHEDLILSLCKSEKTQNQLAKSCARFVTSFDGRFIAKLVNDQDFAMFLSLAPKYFRYVYKSLHRGKASLLVRTIGAYRISLQKNGCGHKRVDWILLYENLTYNVEKPFEVFDLKGAVNSRRRVKPGEHRTKMDLDFLQKTQHLPLCLDTKCKQALDAGVWSDSQFLSKQNVIDYSLLVVVTEGREVYAGIIDYGQKYTFPKAVENRVKTVVMQEKPTILGPMEYGERFREQISERYFVGIADN